MKARFSFFIRAPRWLMLILVISLMLFVKPAYAQDAAPEATCTSQSTGSWNTVGRWSCGHVPVAADAVVIASGHTVTLDITPVTILSLSVSGTFNMNATAGTSRTMNVTGEVTVNNGGTFTLSNATNINTHTLNAGGNFTNNGTFTVTAGGDNINVFLNGTTAQSLGGTTATAFNNLTISNTTAIVSATNDFSIAGTMTVNANATFYAGTFIVSGAGTFTLSAGSTLGIGSPNGITARPTASGNIQTTGTPRDFNVGANYLYNGTAAQTIGTGFPNNLTGDLIINNPGNSVTLSDTKNIANGGVINILEGTFTLNAATSVGNGGAINIANGTFIAGNFLTMVSTSSITRSGGSMTGTIQGTGTYNVTYTGNSMNTSAELTGSGLRNVTVNLTAGQTLTLNANRAPDAGLLITSGIFDLATFTINCGATGGTDTLRINNGATLKIGGTNSLPSGYDTHVIEATSTVEFAGTNQIIPILNSTQNYGNLTTSGSGTKTLTGSVNVEGTFTLGNGITLALGSPTMTLNGAVICSGGSFSSGAAGIVNYNLGSAGQNVCPGNYGNLMFSNFDKVLSPTGTIGIAGTFTTGSATAHTITGSTIDFNGTGAQTIPSFSYNHLTTSNAGGINLGTGTAINVAGNWTNNDSGTVTPGTGTVTFNGTVTQTISGNLTPFNNLTINPGAIVIFPGTNVPTVAGTMLNQGTLQQTLAVNGANVPFLQITDGMVTTKFRGVDIDTTISGANLGDTTLVLQALNTGEYCTENGSTSPAYTKRCYEITPTTDGAATLTLWALTSELNSITEGNLSLYRFIPGGAGWIELTTNRATGNDGGSYSFARGDTPGFSHFLLGSQIDAPTALTLETFTARSTTSPLLAVIALFAFVVVSVFSWKILTKASGQKA